MKQTDKNFFDAIPKVGTQDFNNLSNEMFSGKPKPQTAIEWLEEQYTKQITFLHREDFEQAKQMEKEQQGYSEEDMEKAFNVGFNVGYNDETSPSYLTFEEWIKQFKNK